MDTRELSDVWKGETQFEVIRKDVPDGFTSVGGRLIRKQTTSRPGDIWPEVYEAMSKQMRKKAHAAWQVRNQQIRIARERRGICVLFVCLVM